MNSNDNVMIIIVDHIISITSGGNHQNPPVFKAFWQFCIPPPWKVKRNDVNSKRHLSGLSLDVRFVGAILTKAPIPPSLGTTCRSIRLDRTYRGGSSDQGPN